LRDPDERVESPRRIADLVFDAERRPIVSVDLMSLVRRREKVIP
jgi:hypothetical protein